MGSLLELAAGCQMLDELTSPVQSQLMPLSESGPSCTARHTGDIGIERSGHAADQSVLLLPSRLSLIDEGLHS